MEFISKLRQKFYVVVFGFPDLISSAERLPEWIAAYEPDAPKAL